MYHVSARLPTEVQVSTGGAAQEALDHGVAKMNALRGAAPPSTPACAAPLYDLNLQP
jgi:hypothetical protein